jgi:hypothetical protein
LRDKPAAKKFFNALLCESLTCPRPGTATSCLWLTTQAAFYHKTPGFHNARNHYKKRNTLPMREAHVKALNPFFSLLIYFFYNYYNKKIFIYQIRMRKSARAIAEKMSPAYAAGNIISFIII